MDLLPAVLLSSSVSSPSNVPLLIEKLRARTSYNEAYKEVNQQKIDLGAKRLKILEDELDIKRNEVKARQDKVKLAGLAAYYLDLRQDLRVANKRGDADDVRSIKENMQAVQKRRRDLMAT